jgi:D-sedoheptulose 7-phosphate isomerase
MKNLKSPTSNKKILNEKKPKNKFVTSYLKKSINILNILDHSSIEKTATVVATVRRQGGRLFICGSGGGAGHASHAINEFRKLAGIESYCPSDNVIELTARINDEGWENSYAEWLVASRINKNDGLLVYSVGGGCRLRKVSMNLVHVMMLAKKSNCLRHHGSRWEGRQKNWRMC